MHRAYLTFSLQGAWYAVEASRVREILRLPALTAVPEVPHCIIGVVNYRGHILPVMDLGLGLGLPPRPYRLHDHVIVLAHEGRLLGILVNEVQGVHDISSEARDKESALTASHEGNSPLIRDRAKLDNTPIMILNHDRLLDTAEKPQAYATQATLAVPDGRWSQGTEPARAHDGSPVHPPETAPLLFHDAAPWEREILLDRARTLTSNLGEESAIQRIPFAVVGLGGEYFGIELETVREFTDLQRLTPVPCCPNYIVGDMNLRGDILTVVDIRQTLQMPVAEAAPTAKVIVVPLGDELVGILVDQVFDVLDVDLSQLSPLPIVLKSSNDTYLNGSVPYQGKMLTIIDLVKILRTGGLMVNEEA